MSEDNRALGEFLDSQGIPWIERPCLSMRVVAAEAPTGEIEAVAFTSRMGVRGFFENGFDRMVSPRQVGVVGGGTREELGRFGWKATLQPDRPTAGALGHLLASHLAAGERVLWPRGDLTTGTLAPPLVAAGIVVVEARVYVNEEPPIERVGECSAVVVASPSAVRRFLAANPHLTAAPFIAIGAQTAQAASGCGVGRVVEARGTSIADLFSALATVLPAKA